MLSIDVGRVALSLTTIVLIALVAWAILVAILRRRGWRPTPQRLRLFTGGVVAAAIVVPIAAIVIYTQVINDPDPELDEGDLAAIIADDTEPAIVTTASASATDPATVTEPATATEPAAATAPAAVTEPASASASEPAAVGSEPAVDGACPVVGTAEGAGEFDGEWTVTDESQFGYRVPEILSGVETTATGRSNQITGSLTIAGNAAVAACFEVDVASITSDRDERNSQFRGRIMNTAEFPTASFVLTEAITFDTPPEAGGDPVTTTATGELTMRGVTNEVTFDVTVQAGSDTIGVLGQIPIVFADYGIANPSNPVVSVGDEGDLEFVLAFEQL